VHEPDVEWSWRRRLRATPAEPWDADAELQASDFPTLRELAERWRDDAAEMRSWLAELTDDAVVAPWEGERPGGPALWVFLIHVVEHGITELSDAAVLLRRVGRPTGSLTFLDFIDPVPPKTDDA